jgi:hypothetical protein
MHTPFHRWASITLWTLNSGKNSAKWCCYHIATRYKTHSSTLGLRQNLIFWLIRTKLQDDIEFDLTGVDAPLANALRRIMIAEVTLWGNG